eukprot:g5859.t1
MFIPATFDAATRIIVLSAVFPLWTGSCLFSSTASFIQQLHWTALGFCGVLILTDILICVLCLQGTIMDKEKKRWLISPLVKFYFIAHIFELAFIFTFGIADLTKFKEGYGADIDGNGIIDGYEECLDGGYRENGGFDRVALWAFLIVLLLIRILSVCFFLCCFDPCCMNRCFSGKDDVFTSFFRDHVLLSHLRRYDRSAVESLRMHIRMTKRHSHFKTSSRVQERKEEKLVDICTYKEDVFSFSGKLLFKLLNDKAFELPGESIRPLSYTDVFAGLTLIKMEQDSLELEKIDGDGRDFRFSDAYDQDYIDRGLDDEEPLLLEPDRHKNPRYFLSLSQN